jgi:hypothetical protein
MMLSQDIILVLLEASISGAGLVLAVYALVIAFSKRLFENNLTGFISGIKYQNEFFDKWFGKKFPNDVSEKAKGTMLKWLESWTFPSYLRFGFALTFACYLITTLLCISWLAEIQRSIVDSTLLFFFTASTIVFLFVGLLSIKDIHRIMRQDYFELLKGLENEKE